jgi:hypothetical protein
MPLTKPEDHRMKIKKKGFITAVHFYRSLEQSAATRTLTFTPEKPIPFHRGSLVSVNLNTGHVKINGRTVVKARIKNAGNASIDVAWE